MMRYIRKYGLIKFLYLYISVRFYGVSLGTFSLICRDMDIRFAMDLGRYFYRDRHSYEEIKTAIVKSDRNYNEHDRQLFEEELIDSTSKDSSINMKYIKEK
jgi:hypothetical protein